MECARPMVEPRLQGRGGERPALPPHLGSPAAAGGSLCARLAFLKPLFVLVLFFKEETNGAQKRAALRPRPPPSAFLFFLLCSLSGLVSNFPWTFLEGVFLSPDLYCKLVRTRHEHTARRGTGRPGQRANSGLRRCRKVKALFKTIARLILLFILSFLSNRNTA